MSHESASFRAGEVVELLRVTRRQLHYWSRTDLVRPSERTPGGHSRYSFEDLVALKSVVRLIDAGVPLQRIRSSIRRLRALLPNVRRPLVELVLVTTGDLVLAFHAGAAIDAISGQEWLFPVAQLQSEIDAWRGRAPAAKVERPPAELEAVWERTA